MVEYEVIDREGEIILLCGDYRVATLYYESEHTATPLTKEEAEKIMDIVRTMVEDKHPASELDDEDFEGSGIMGDFFKYMMLKSLME